MLIRLTLMMLAVALMWGCTSTCPMCDGDGAGRHPHIGKVEHVVMFKFKEGTSADKIAEIEREFAALRDKIPQIAQFEYGTNVSPEGLDKGFTHCFIVTFENEADRDAYLPHPAHKAFVEIAKPHFADVHVIDFIAKD